MREFDTGDLAVVRKQVKSNIKDGVSQILVFKKKVTYRVLDKASPRLYRLHCLHFCEGLRRPGIKVKESTARMKNIPSTMVIHKHIDGGETIFSTMAGPVANNPLGGMV